MNGALPEVMSEQVREKFPGSPRQNLAQLLITIKVDKSNMI
jgi:hypothetical protein